ncbi:WYL domain-containing protein [Thiospirochaeta perfilievii]|uniref:WYL domain-containing protein n=1 Tax=Thiospirochaeta perfilievii TaxID=252967 RepID=A0A5C1Q7M9_9SPIO|nr:WYL domain-containing protein [Thiospirochaeta perfilievii]QEN03318.1 WYL domain-containing protein [Thiospirochaeta perfilievii]
MAEKEGNKFERMMRILAKLSQYSWMTGQEIADMLGVNKRTVFRYINDINIPFEEGGIGLIESGREGYRLYDTNFLDTLKGIDNMYTIAAIQTSPFGQTLTSNNIFKNDILNKIAPKLNRAHYINDKILKHLLDALIQNRILEVEYNKEGNIKTYLILPLRIISNTGTEYLNLYCFNDGYEKILNFVISKIVNITPKDKCNNKILIGEKLAYINNRWGTFVSGPQEFEDDVKFEVDDSMYLKLLSQPLHSTQQYINENGKHIFSLQVHNLQEFARWTITFGDHITVLESDRVIESILWHANRLLEKYE